MGGPAASARSTRTISSFRPGAGSDNLTNYEVGLKGRWLDGKLTANLAAYYIDWRNIQVQANRQSDSVQFATNVGRAASKGLEAEITIIPAHGLVLGLNGSLNDVQGDASCRRRKPRSPAR